MAGSIFLRYREKSIKIYECFDGDLPDMIEKKKASLDQFQQALNLYFNKEFANFNTQKESKII